MYVFNLVFEIHDASKVKGLNAKRKKEAMNNGLFSPKDVPKVGSTSKALQAAKGVSIPTALLESKKWVMWGGEEPPDPHPPSFDPEADNWQNPMRVKLKLKRSNDPGWICIRVAHKGGHSLAPKNATAQLVVAWGRPVNAKQPQASPFVDKDGHVQSTFIFDEVRDNVQYKTTNGWLFPLGVISRKSPNQSPSERYEFAVGLIVTADYGKKYYFGEDPGMDIDM
jgi:hypothetical protein